MKKISTTDLIIIISIILFVFTADIISKSVIRKDLVFPGNRKPVIKNFLNITYVRNTGIILGILGNLKNKWILNSLIIFAFCILVYIFIVMLKDINHTFVNICFGLIIGGAISNIVDRLIHGYVTDFIDVYVRSFHWPTFNIADSSITVGITLLILFNLFSGKP